jgi:hypothetical protein
MDAAFSSNIAILAEQTCNPGRDWLVAVVAICLGLSIFYAAWSRNEWCHELGSVQLIERIVGRSGARWFLMGIGAMCCLLAMQLIAPQFGQPNASDTYSNQHRLLPLPNATGLRSL